MLKNTILALGVMLSLFATAYVNADEAGKFTIVSSSDGKVFLINNETGANWIYSRMSDSKQGWVSLDFFTSDGKNVTTTTTTTQK